VDVARKALLGEDGVGGAKGLSNDQNSQCAADIGFRASGQTCGLSLSQDDSQRRRVCIPCSVLAFKGPIGLGFPVNVSLF